MKLSELLTLSLHSLRSNLLRSALTTLGIIIGVFAVILLVSIGTGLQSYITNQISGLGSNLIFIIPGSLTGNRAPGGSVTNKLTTTDAKILTARLKDLANVGPIIQKTASVKYKSKTNKATSIIGTTGNYPDIVKTVIVKGSYFTEAQARSGAKVAVIGQTVLTNLFGHDDPIGKKSLDHWQQIYHYRRY